MMVAGVARGRLLWSRAVVDGGDIAFGFQKMVGAVMVVARLQVQLERLDGTPIVVVVVVIHRHHSSISRTTSASPPAILEDNEPARNPVSRGRNLEDKAQIEPATSASPPEISPVQRIVRIASPSIFSL
jgi:hypothetical protein